MFNSTTSFQNDTQNRQENNQSKYNQSLVSPMSLRMLKVGMLMNPETQAFEIFGNTVQLLDQVMINLVTVIGRVLLANFEDNNQLKIKIDFTDDTDAITMNYFVKNDQQEKEQTILNVDTGDYVKFVIMPKLYQNKVYYNAVHYEMIKNLNALTLHFSQIMFINQRRRNDLTQFVQPFELSDDEPIETQVESYFKWSKQPVAIHKLMEVFKPRNVSIQHMKVIVEKLKQKQVIMDCMTPQTYMSFK